MYYKQTTTKLNLASLIIINCIGTYKREMSTEKVICILQFSEVVPMCCKNESKKASSELFERGCNTVHSTISFLVPVFVYFRMIYLASEGCFPHKKNGYFRVPSLQKNRLFSKGNCHLSFWITAQHLGLSDLCRKCVNHETYQINLLNLKHLFAFNLNL